MTDLSKLLYVANIVEPDKKWISCGFGKDVMSTNSLGHVTIYEPHKPTERGQAQLMDIVFATYRKIGYEPSKKYNYEEATGKLLDGLLLKDAGMLINLAAEVL